MKLLAILDFTHFKQTGRSVTGQTYFTWKRGPVPRSFYYELKRVSTEQPKDISESISISEGIPVKPQKGKKKERIFLKIIAKKGFDPKHFTQRELDLLQSISEDFKDVPTDKMVRYSHLKKEPWRKTKATIGLNKPIDYMLAIDNSSDSLNRDEIIDRIEDNKQVEDILSKI